MDERSLSAVEGNEILLVDPSAEARRPVSRDLTRLGMQVWEADSLQGANEVIRRSPPGQIISELRLPDGSAIDLLCAVKLLGASSRLVILTSYGSIAAAVKAIQCGATNFLTKPATGEEILVAFGKSACSCSKGISSCLSRRGTREPPVRATRKQPRDVGGYTLDRAIWEYISRTIDETGSIHAAARRLGIERRSLQRMLAKYPPPESAARPLAESPSRAGQ